MTTLPSAFFLHRAKKTNPKKPWGSVARHGLMLRLCNWGIYIYVVAYYGLSFVAFGLHIVQKSQSVDN